MSIVVSLDSYLLAIFNVPSVDPPSDTIISISSVFPESNFAADFEILSILNHSIASGSVKISSGALEFPKSNR